MTPKKIVIQRFEQLVDIKKYDYELRNTNVKTLKNNIDLETRM